jgi:hypothetical protein
LGLSGLSHEWRSHAPIVMHFGLRHESRSQSPPDGARLNLDFSPPMPANPLKVLKRLVLAAPNHDVANPQVRVPLDGRACVTSAPLSLREDDMTRRWREIGGIMSTVLVPVEENTLALVLRAGRASPRAIRAASTSGSRRWR